MHPAIRRAGWEGVRTLLALALYCGALALIGYGGWQAWERFVAPPEAEQPAQTEDTAQPVEWVGGVDTPLRGAAAVP